MARPSLRIDEGVRKDVDAKFIAILSDLAKPGSTKKELLAAARAVRLGRAMGVSDDIMSSYIAIVSGANKHETDFIAALEAL